jgi:aminobutyraldehyde dehydrogenase
VAGFVERAQMPATWRSPPAARLRRAGFFYEPTVIAGARQDDEIVKREVFGPVVRVTRFTDAEQAIAWANDSDYGLASSCGRATSAGDARGSSCSTAARGSTRTSCS